MPRMRKRMRAGTPTRPDALLAKMLSSRRTATTKRLTPGGLL
jgi:hypothetical protein